MASLCSGRLRAAPPRPPDPPPRPLRPLPQHLVLGATQRLRRGGDRVELRTDLGDHAVPGGDLDRHPHLADGDVEPGAGQGVLAVRRLPHPDAAGGRQHLRPQGVGAVRRAQHTRARGRAGPSCPGSAPARRRPRRSGAAAAGPPATTADPGRRRWSPAAASRSSGRPAAGRLVAQHHPGDVGPPRRVAGAGAHADALHQQRWQVLATLRQRDQQRHPGRGGQLALRPRRSPATPRPARPRRAPGPAARRGRCAPSRRRERPAGADGVDPQIVQGGSTRRRRRRSSPARPPRGSAPPPARCRAPGPPPRPAGRTRPAPDRVRARPGRPRSSRSRIVAQRRCGGSAADTSTSALVARRPARVTAVAVIATELGHHRVHRRLHHREIGAGVEQRAEQHVPGHSGRGVDPGVPSPDLGLRTGRCGDLRREVAGTVAVVDVDHRDPGAQALSIASSAATPPNEAP